MMPDEDLLAAIDQMAASSQARGDAIGYYLDELDRRERRRLNRTLVRLTWAIVVLTVVVAALSTVMAIDALST